MRYSIDPRRISHDRLGDEVIIIDLNSGSYYSGSGPAAELWTIVCRGASLGEAASLLASTYACDERTVRNDIENCLNRLVEKGVLNREETNSWSGAQLVLPALERGEWLAPKFDEYSDMWDLLQFDPVHDVGEAGWPFAIPTAKS